MPKAKSRVPTWRDHDVHELACHLAWRPGHEAVLTDVVEILRRGFGAAVKQLSHEIRLPDCLRERKTGRRYLGIATDGALHEVGWRLLDAGEPSALLSWLEPKLADRDDLHPDPAAVQGALGQHSFVFDCASNAFARLWEKHRADPEAALKRDLWHALLLDL